MNRALRIAVALALAAAVGAPAFADGSTTTPIAIKGSGKGVQKTVQRTIAPLRAKEGVSVDQLREITPEAIANVQERWKKLLEAGTHKPGPIVLVDPKVKGSEVKPLSPPTRIPSTDAPGDLVFFQTTNLDPTFANGFQSTVPEPSVAASGDRAFFTINWFAASSDDSGATWAGVNPNPGPFPAPAGSGFCCDQLAIEDPGSNSLLWVQQFIPGSQGALRVNVDQNTDGTFDCAYDFTPQMIDPVAFPPGNFPDFPHAAVDNNNFYMASNVFAGGFTGAFAVRMPLSVMSACGAQTFDAYVDTSGFGSFRFTEGAEDTMWFADHNTTSQMAIWTWPDAAPQPTMTLHNVTGWMNNARTCPPPDNNDWCGFIDFRILGAFATQDQVGWMWTPSQGGSFPFPYTRVAIFNQSDLSLASEHDIWSNDFAYVYPSSTSNRRGDVGGTIMFGGGTDFPSCATFLVDQFNDNDFDQIDLATVTAGTSGPGSNRSGDYTDSDVHGTVVDTFVGACYSYPATNRANPHFAWFGREISDPVTNVFWDGFETGNISVWGSTVP